MDWTGKMRVAVSAELVPLIVAFDPGNTASAPRALEAKVWSTAGRRHFEIRSREDFAKLWIHLAYTLNEGVSSRVGMLGARQGHNGDLIFLAILQECKRHSSVDAFRCSFVIGRTIIEQARIADGFPDVKTAEMRPYCVLQKCAAIVGGT